MSLAKCSTLRIRGDEYKTEVEGRVLALSENFATYSKRLPRLDHHRLPKPERRGGMRTNEKEKSKEELL